MRSIPGLLDDKRAGMADDSTIENRVYLFKDLAAAFVGAAADRLCSGDEAERSRAIDALAELARISCVVADAEDEQPERVAELVRKG